MTDRLLRIEVQGANVIVDGEDASGSRRLGVFPLGELQDVFARLGEPHETEKADNRFVMIWKLGLGGTPIDKLARAATGSGTFKPLKR